MSQATRNPGLSTLKNHVVVLCWKWNETRPLQHNFHFQPCSVWFADSNDSHSIGYTFYLLAVDLCRNTIPIYLRTKPFVSMHYHEQILKTSETSSTAGCPVAYYHVTNKMLFVHASAALGASIFCWKRIDNIKKDRLPSFPNMGFLASG